MHRTLTLAIVGAAQPVLAKGMGVEITHVTLTRATAVSEVIFPAGTRVELHADWNAHTYRFGTPVLHSAVLGAGGAPCGVQLPKGTKVSFAVHSLRTVARYTYGDFYVSSRNDRERAMMFIVPSPVVLDGVSIEKGADVAVQCLGAFGVGPRGEPRKLRRAGPTTAPYTLDGFRVPAGSWIGACQRV